MNLEAHRPAPRARHRLRSPRRSVRHALLSVLGLTVLAGSGCGGSTQAGANTAAQPTATAYPNQPPPQPGGYPAQPGQPAPPVQPTQPAPYPQNPPAQSGANTPLTVMDLNYMRASAQSILAELVANLTPDRRSRVQGIPLVVDDTLGEVNAFASCTESGKSAMAITDGLLQIEAVLARSQAHDEVYGTQKVDEYIRLAAANLRPKQPVPAPPPGFLPGELDGRVGPRSLQVFEEQVAFVLGHELGHHHLGHLPCTASADPLGAGEAGRVLSNVVPLFNQPNEIASDLAGVQNVLDAGRARGARGAFAWTEGGGLLTMRFFSGFGDLTPGTLLTAFERSHPPPQLRIPVIQQASANWRSGGQALPFPILPGF